MSQIKISEAKSVQFPMVKHASTVGWEPLPPEEAERMRQGRANMLFSEVLEDKLQEFNPWLTEDQARAIVESIEALPATIEGNREVLRWLRGERQWNDETEQRQRPVQVVDYAFPGQNALHVTWEWKIEPPARAKGNRADVMFVVNGIPVTIVEHKNPKDRNALTKAVTQLRRYEKETPELLTQAQLHNETHLIDYWYGVTWNVNRRMLFKWKHTSDESYHDAVQAFFEPRDFLRTLREWVLFYIEDGETKKSVLREHQRGAVDAVVERCADPAKNRGLIWHTQGSGKTFTLLTAAQLILSQKERFKKATVILVVDRTELEGQLKEWVDKLLGEMQANDIPVRRANSKDDLQDIFESDFRGLVVSMIHKFETIRKDSSNRDNIFVFIDEAHRSVAADLGSYLMAAVPNSTIIGFTGTPVGGTGGGGSGSFQIFGSQDENGYLHKYSIIESIDDETTLPIKYLLAPSSMSMEPEDLDEQFYALASDEDVTDIDELNKVLQRAVGLRTFLGADSRVKQVAEFVAKHFKENVDPLGYKAFLVAVDRETCAKYKRALDELLPPEWSEVVYSKNTNDVVDRPDVHALQLSDDREKEVRRQFKKADQQTKILIVTDKLLTGYDAPILYAMYLDKPMRDHVLLQALARVNRPYVDSEGVQKKVGLVVDFVGILKELHKALRFDSADTEGALEDLDVLMADLLLKIDAASTEYLQVESGQGADEQLESLVYGKFIAEEERKKFFHDFRDIESLWEIVSPSAELRDHIATYKRLSVLYAAVRNAYSEATSFTADLEHKTKRLIEESATQDGLGRFTKVATFDVQTLEALGKDDGPPEEKVFNLLRGLQKEMEDNPASAVVLQSIKEKADRVIENLEERKVNGLAALDELKAIAEEKDRARDLAKSSGLSERAFGVYWVLSKEPALQRLKVDIQRLAINVELAVEQFPHWRQNADEERRLRSGLYKPLLELPAAPRKDIIEKIMNVLEKV
ncbi:HsdR family type I site-specific deoxyribonuclease [Rhodococcus hoagii]|uniref:Type I restriction enzyme endonuclease subunit n=1 Tax=Rhodococcus hoagii TaxID=43767 RepID=A0AAE3B909_RHOHA|nr:HsdR family type I site-specific deoxyribonuclease [Prescottella equi]MBM4540049.1 HsdR family type I site-specific deoxyribonuclease [Prescottella equi]MBM4712859.1 HsdR family type I site-specific deoxyribonuclease [Prescottella equi]NKS12838.1 HsdR family type I site-specific deoxyribonuclease [Prescottella equi]BCN68215.1 type I deoxyribonuclease HsdR [Prescottella equi]